MVIVMAKNAPAEAVERVINDIKALGFTPHISEGEERTLIGAIGPAPTEELREQLAGLVAVDTVVRITKPYKLASREFRHDDSFVIIGGSGGANAVKTGNGRFVVAAGPCGVESRGQLLDAAAIVQRHGAAILRGGAYKPRTSPYAFQGLQEQGLAILEEARANTGMPVVTEVTAPELVEKVAASADMLQIGARNSQNFALLAEVGKTGKPVLFKRGMSTSIAEFLQAAEYVLSQGNPNVILCERGIRTFETSTRFTLDVSAVPVLKELTHLPVWVDPSHAAGRRPLVASLALASAAAGADGLIVEVHPRPEEAKSDAAQQLDDAEFGALMDRLGKVVQALGKSL
ncbi:MAG: 3-deoxy-7-phosphoheptulonate synthase [Trueperaceae bacterium]